MTALSPTSRKLVWRLVLWGLAIWLVLQLHDLSFAQEHSICGPWGCGPTIPALLAAHGFWLVTLLPLAYWVRSFLPGSRAVVLGSILMGLGAIGIASVTIWELATWPTIDQAEFRVYTFQHTLFALATLVEVPLIPGVIAGLILARTTRRRDQEKVIDGCGDQSCGRPDAIEEAGPALDRLAVGRPFPWRSFPILEDKIAIIPDGHSDRTTVLYFMRAAGCSICHGHVRRLATSQPDLDALGADIFIIHPGSSRASRALETSLNLRFPIVASRDLMIFDKLGSKARRLVSLPMSGTLLIDGRGMIRSVRLSRIPTRGFHLADLLAVLHQIKGETFSAHDTPAVTLA